MVLLHETRPEYAFALIFVSLFMSYLFLFFPLLCLMNIQPQT